MWCWLSFDYVCKNVQHHLITKTNFKSLNTLFCRKDIYLRFGCWSKARSVCLLSKSFDWIFHLNQVFFSFTISVDKVNVIIIALNWNEWMKPNCVPKDLKGSVDTQKHSWSLSRDNSSREPILLCVSQRYGENKSI